MTTPLDPEAAPFPALIIGGTEAAPRGDLDTRYAEALASSLAFELRMTVAEVRERLALGQTPARIRAEAGLLAEGLPVLDGLRKAGLLPEVPPLLLLGPDWILGGGPESPVIPSAYGSADVARKRFYPSPNDES